MSLQFPESGDGPGRKLWGLFLFVLGVVMLVLNHWNATSESKVSIWFLLFAPTFCLLGLGTLFDERILAAAKADEAATVPPGPKIAATLLVVAGLVISFWLMLSFYKVR